MSILTLVYILLTVLILFFIACTLHLLWCQRRYERHRGQARQHKLLAGHTDQQRETKRRKRSPS